VCALHPPAPPGYGPGVKSSSQQWFTSYSQQISSS